MIPSAPKEPSVLIELTEKDQHVTIRRERPATKAERENDPEAEVMAEVLTVVYSNCEPPKITINRDLCAGA